MAHTVSRFLMVFTAITFALSLLAEDAVKIEQIDTPEKLENLLMSIEAPEDLEKTLNSIPQEYRKGIVQRWEEARRKKWYLEQKAAYDKGELPTDEHEIVGIWLRTGKDTGWKFNSNGTFESFGYRSSIQGTWRISSKVTIILKLSDDQIFPAYFTEKGLRIWQEYLPDYVPPVYIKRLKED